ncbi:MAG: carboxypeptidase regulatory-like domain-containing protein [Bacteroidales bacterium]|nr:carboxypeptidase regulatory-like domain-containing protein [Bacteroidales bacterium]
MKKTLKVLCFALACSMLAAHSFAQVTTSSMTGKVSDAGSALSGATVSAVHTPSGSIYDVTANSSGLYNLQGMRSGGPYTVTVSYAGYPSAVYTDLYLPLGEIFRLDVDFSQGQERQLGAVSVTGSKTKFAIERTGATTNISNEQLRLLPTISRSIRDFSRLSPYSGANNSFSGRDGRSSNFTVDGANLNNNFGLSDALPGGGNPISLDAIEEMQVVIAPFDVRQSNFIGGGINAITKSGTNTFKGSAYAYFNDENMRGNKIGDYVPEGERPKSGKQIYGATIGGPIVKDKLFFFANFEYENSPKPVTNWRASADGVADPDNFISHARQSDLDKFSQLLRERYGYETGSSTDFPGGTSNMKALARFDWNIDKSNRLSVRYNYTKNDNWIEPNGNSSDNGYRLNNTYRIGPDAMSYITSCYSMANVVHSVSAELNSSFGSKFNNQVLVTYSDLNDQRGTKSSPFPFIEIMNGDDVAAAGLDPKNSNNFSPYMSAGLELFTWNNGVANQVATVTDNFTAYLGKHKVTAGVNFEYQFAKNSYMRNGTGYYRFFSFSDFINNAAPEAFALTYGYGGELSPAGKVSYAQLAFYAQDEWEITDRFKLNYGIRLDNTFFLNKILTNNAIKDLDFGGKNVNTGEWPGTKMQFEPRVGFNCDVLGDKSLTLRGGTGLFSGRIPLVFFTNMPQNSGMIQGASNQIYTKYKDGAITGRDERLDNMYINGKLITDINTMITHLGLPAEISPENGTIQSNMAGVDPNFKMPQIWKTSLAVDYRFPVNFPLKITVEGIFNKYVNDIRLINYNIKDMTAENGYFHYEGPDGRWIAPSNNLWYKNDSTYDAAHKKNVGVLGVLTNTNKGYGYTANVTLTAEPVKNLNIMAAYTHTESYEVSGMPGNNATSAWQGLPTVEGANFNGAQWSQYVTPDRVMASLSYSIEYGKGSVLGSTDFGLFYQTYSPYRYSYTYSNDFNGDGINQDLIYIPKSKDEIAWKTPEDADKFWSYLENDKYLSENKGRYAEAYKAYAPPVHRFDLHFAQNFTIKAGKTKNTLQISLDILNFGNLLKNTWGVNKEMNAALKNGQILKYEGLNGDNKPMFSFAPGDAVEQSFVHYNDALTQTWQLQIGIRYIFN